MISGRVSLKQLSKILQPLPRHREESVRAMLEYWCQKILVRHFQFGNDSAYNYPALDARYLERKRKKYGRTPMLVASGRLKEDVTKLYKIYKIQGSIRVVLYTPEYGKFVKQVRDYTLISKRDRRDLARYYRENMTMRRKSYCSYVRRVR